MLIRAIKLINFRNYDFLELDFKKNINILYGDNAQGKTNVVESIFLCSTGRSHRTIKDIELVKKDKNEYYVSLEVEKKYLNTNIEIAYNKQDKKKVKVNGIRATRMVDLIGKVNTVMFSPEDLMIVKDGPQERRRFLDIVISQIKPSYFYFLQQYNKVLKQKNILLKEIKRSKILIDTLEVWNEKLTYIGSRIIKERRDFTSRLSCIARKKHYHLTNNLEELNIRYEPSIKISNCEDIKEIEKSFKLQLERIEENELIKCVSLCGPQRDDIDIILNNRSLKQYGSQGQKRTSILSLKLSEIDIIKEEVAEVPILLLDDVMSELDIKRQALLMDNIEGIQTFITCTDKSFIKEMHKYDIDCFNVINGNVLLK